MSATACPNHDQLSAYLVGMLEEDQAGKVNEHLETCPRCESTLVGLEKQSDPFIFNLRQPVVEDDYLQEPEYEQLVSAAASICREAKVEDPADRQPLFERLKEAIGDVSDGPVGVGDSAAAESPGDMVEPADLGEIRDYRLLSKLGAGGMGTVYKARHTKLDRIVALKVLPAKLTKNKQAVARFEQEMKAIGKLDHENIVRALDAGEADGVHYLVMELVEGMDLSRLGERHVRLPIADACEIVRQAAVGLQHAHEHELIHRDIKPSNLMLTRDGCVKLLDLGLARLHDQPATEELTATGQLMGTVDYMAPEQFGNSHGVDIRADIYGLGCTLYKLLTGHVPYGGPGYSSVYQKMKGHNEAPLPSIVEQREDIPAELTTILQRMLAKAPDDRFATPAEVATALESLTLEHNLQELARAALGETGTEPSAGGPRSTSNIFGQRTETIVPQPESFGPSPQKSAHRPKRRRLIATAVTAAFVLLAAVVIFINTGRGQLEITVNVDDVKVTVDGKTPTNVEITSPRDKILIKIRDLPAGNHVMEVNKDGFETLTKSFRIVRAGKVELIAKLIPLPKLPGVQMPTAGEPAAKSVNVAIQQGDPLGFALVAEPAELPGLRSWTLEILGHRGVVRDLQHSPDGRWLATASDDGTLRIWETETGEMSRIFAGTTDRVMSVSWSPDSRLVASAGNNGEVIRIWDVSKGRQKTQFGSVAKNVSPDVAWSPDGRLLAVSADKLVTFYDPASGQVVEAIPMAEKINAIAWSPDSNRLAIASDGKAIELWDLTTMKRVHRFTFDRSVRSVSYSPDGKLVAGGDAREIRLWETASGKRSLPETVLSSGGQIAFSPDGKRLASAAGKRLVVYSVASGGLLTEFDWQNNLKGLSWATDGKTIACGMSTGPNPACMGIWNPTSGQSERLGERTMSVHSLAWSGDGERLFVSPSGENALLVLDSSMYTSQQMAEKIGYSRLQFSTDGKRLAGRRSNYDLYLLDRESGKRVGKPVARNVLKWSWSPDAKRVVVCFHARRVGPDGAKLAEVIDVESREVVLKLSGFQSAISDVAYAPDGKRIVGVSYASSQDGNTVRVWDAESGETLVVPTPSHNKDALFSNVAWSPDSKRFVTAWGYGDVVFDAESGKGTVWFPAELGGYHPSSGLYWTRDGKLLLSWVYYRIAVFDATTQKRLHTFPIMFGGNLGPWCFSSDDRLMAVIDASQLIRVWEPASGRMRGTLMFVNGEELGSGVAVSAEGHFRQFGSEPPDMRYHVLTEAGEQLLLKPEEFERRYGWKNDPEKARLFDNN